MSLTNKQANVANAQVNLGDEISRETGSGAIAYSLLASSNIRIVGIMLHLSTVGGNENFTVSIDSAAGSAYDTVLMSQDMHNLTDLNSTDGFIIPQGDTLSITFANTGAATYGLTVLYADGR